MTDKIRRQFLKKGLFGLAVLPLGMGVLTTTAFAATLPRLNPSAANAKALAYKATVAEAQGHAAFKAGSSCANCNFFQAANEGCMLFPGASVEPNGWCQAWVKKPG